MLMWLAWGLFWLSVALVPIDLLFHIQAPPFTRYEKVPAEAGWIGLFGMFFILLRFLLQVPPVLAAAFRPAPAGLPPLVWLLLIPVAYLVVEVGLAFAYYVWMSRATDTTYGAQDRAVWVLGPVYFLALIAESGALYWLLRSGGDGD
jgi:hypothetical protein